MTPVEAGITCATGTFIFLASALQHFMAASSPFRVAQLALPALTRMALTRPRDARMCCLAILTGSGLHAIRVKTAAAEAGVSETISPRSSLLEFLRMPA